jgi:hypothetical protein
LEDHVALYVWVCGLPPPVTVTVQVAVLPPSSVVALIVAVPEEMPLTMPFGNTVVTAGLLVFHATFLFVALEGVMAAVSVSVSPALRLKIVLFKLTPVTATLPPLPPLSPPSPQDANDKPITAIKAIFSNSFIIAFIKTFLYGAVLFITVYFIANYKI